MKRATPFAFVVLACCSSSATHNAAPPPTTTDEDAGRLALVAGNRATPPSDASTVAPTDGGAAVDAAGGPVDASLALDAAAVDGGSAHVDASTTDGGRDHCPAWLCDAPTFPICEAARYYCTTDGSTFIPSAPCAGDACAPGLSLCLCLIPDSMPGPPACVGQHLTLCEAKACAALCFTGATIDTGVCCEDDPDLAPACEC